MLNKTASASAATPSVAQQMQEPQSEITPELKERLMREGYNPEDFSRINNIIKQAKERNGFYL
jgi:TFIIF-interacting CTD phosphatase-like protein